jgi:hypothetical protein
MYLLLRPIVSRSVVALGVVVVVDGSGVPRLVAMFVTVISIVPVIAAIAGGETNSCHDH